MSLSREFNALTGKVVSLAEFRARLMEEGLDPDTNISPTQEQVTRKVLKLEAEGEDLSDLQPSVYLSGSSVKMIEEKALSADNEDIAYARIADEMKAQTRDGYFDVFPAAKIMALFHDDQKMVAGYIRAAKACADHRQKVEAGELRDALSIFEKTARRVEAKFGI